MAKILGKDQATYSRERDGFLRDLQHFHETRGTPFRRCPTLGGKEIDLYLLYTLVTAQGGWIKVNSKNSWVELLPCFQLPGLCVNGSVALKQIYLRYLDRWEKVHFLGEEADRGSDDDEESRHKRWSARSLHSVPYTYNYSQHNILESNREYNHLSSDLYKASDYDRLALSLISPLPNEQDFAINVCTLLSSDGKHTLKLDKHPRIIDYLLGHAGVFNHSSLRNVFVYNYNDIRKKPIHNFWKDVLETKEFLDLTNESKFVKQNVLLFEKNSKKDEDSDPQINLLFPPTGSSSSNVSVSENAPMEVDERDDVVIVRDSNSGDCVLSEETNRTIASKLCLDDTDSELFCVKRTLGTQDYVGQRVLQIATILRNLSFIEENIPVLVQNKTFIRFLLLCASSQWSILKNLGLDMLGNLAVEFQVKDLQCDELATILVKIVTNGLQSDDRASCISSLEVLNKLSQNEENEEALLKNLERNVYERVCSFLTIHDVMLLIYTLECLYSLSSLGERSCNLIVANHGVVDTLVSLVTVEGKSYGPKACIGMKLVETVPQQGTAASLAAATTAASNSVTNTTNINNTVTTNASTVTTSATSTPVVSASAKPVITSPSSTPARNVQMVPQRLIAMTPTTTSQNLASCNNVVVTTSTGTAGTNSNSLTPQQMIQQQHAHQQTIHENEQFALAWLRATYEPVSNGKIDHQELYKHYISSCSRIGRRGVISPLHFPRCVRSVFGGTVGPNPMKPANSNDPQYYEGIKLRSQPLVVNMPQQPQQVTSISNLSTISTPTTTKIQNRRKNNSGSSSSSNTTLATLHTVITSPPSKSPVLTVVAASADAENNGSGSTTPGIVTVSSPASPILKAQLSAPPKQRETSVSVVGQPTAITSKSQVMAHPHLSQALLGTLGAVTTAATTSSTTASTSVAQQMQIAGTGQSCSTSLIKSLLATKVNDCMTTTMSMRTASDCQNVAQVAARQRLLAQQSNNTNSSTTSASSTIQSPDNLKSPIKLSRLNGARQQLFTDSEVIGDPAVSSTTQCSTSIKGKKEPPQPPPPPLAPLSNSAPNKQQLNIGTKTNKVIENEDSDSIGNTSLASSTGLGTIGLGGISSTEDGDNSLTSFEGLLNGIPNIDNPLVNEDSNSKDHTTNTSTISLGTSDSISANKTLRLADLLEKKYEKSPPQLVNGALGKEKSIDLLENHIEKALQQHQVDVDNKNNLKRTASEDIVDSEPKKMLFSSSNVNGADSPLPDSVSSSNGGADDSAPATVSTAAAKLFADIAADILEDEDEEQLLQVANNSIPNNNVDAGTMAGLLPTPQPQLSQIIVDNNQQVLRQIIVSQSNTVKNQGQTVIVQNPSQQRGTPVVLQQSTGQFLLSQSLQGQVQFVTSSQSGQYVIQTSSAQGTYMVAQPQTAVVHGQPQTVLVAQTSQQQGTGAKTIIILQQQPISSSTVSGGGGGGATHHQKVVVTPQGQQMVVTQVPRPVLHTSSVSNNNVQQGSAKILKSGTVVTGVGVNNSGSATVFTTTITTTTTTTVGGSQQHVIQNGVIEEVKITKPRIVRDLNTPYVCEWDDCNIETKFKSANEVYLHVCDCHCPTGSEEIMCQWDRCDNMKRKRFSLMTHLHDKHCNSEAMKQSLLRRKQSAQHGGKVEAPPTTSVTPHPGYAPDAALHAIKRHALEFVNPKELQLKGGAKQSGTPVVSAAVVPTPRSGGTATPDQDDNEGPVTKSIRLTASLILRNLVIYSTHCRRYLKHYEPHLANVALSNVESSRTIAQVLYDMNESSNLR